MIASLKSWVVSTFFGSVVTSVVFVWTTARTFERYDHRMETVEHRSQENSLAIQSSKQERDYKHEEVVQRISKLEKGQEADHEILITILKEVRNK